jgi:mono/diheme cytochrome c family protein
MRSTSALPLIVLALTAASGRSLAASDPAAVAAAQVEFATTCARCHNADGSGYAALGIPSFIDPHWQGAHTDAELEQAIANGKNGRMPPFGSALSQDQISTLVREVVRRFAPFPAKGPSRPAPPAPPAVAIEPKLAPPGYGAGPVVLGSVGVYTEHNDNARSGANLRETILTPANVNPRQFGLLFRHVVDEQVFAQPLYVPNLALAGGRHNVVIVATAANTLYAFDADRDAAPYWKVNLGLAGSVEQHHFWCLDILGDMGIVGTPVVDPGTHTLYVVALTNESTGFVQRLHALDLATGAERPNSPVVITAAGFDPILQNQRPALLLSRGSLYVGYSSHCDAGAYHGYLFRFDPSTLAQLGVLNLTPEGEGGSIWQSGQGPAADSSGNITFITSNGSWDGRRDFSDSFVKVSPDLRILDWFTPTDYKILDDKDHDINSSGAMLIPGTHEAMGASKEGFVYLVNDRKLGHLGNEHAVQVFKASKTEINGGGVFWKSRSRGGMIYLWGQDDALHAYAFTHGKFDPNPIGIGRETSAYPGGILAISANGDRDGILWANAALAAHGSGHINGPGVLRAYDANDVTRELWDSNMSPDRDSPGRVSKNAPPTVANGKVYLASFGTLPVGTGALYVFGLLPPGAERP